MIATLQLVTRDPVPVRAVQRHQPALLAEFDCNENCATMTGGGRVYGRCLHLTLHGSSVETQTYRKSHAHRPMESDEFPMRAIAPLHLAFGTFNPTVRPGKPAASK